MYKKELLELGPARISVLKLSARRSLGEPVDLGEDPEKTLESLARSVEEPGDYVEAVAEARGQILRVGIYKDDMNADDMNAPGAGGVTMLFQRPARLVKVGTFSLPKRSGVTAEESLGGSAPEPYEEKILPHVTEDMACWHTPNEDLYVFEGEANLGEQVGVVISTGAGERIHISGGGEKAKIPKASGKGRKAERRGKKRKRAKKRKQRP